MIPYTTNDDIVRCKSIVELELKKNAIVVNPKKLDELTIDMQRAVAIRTKPYSSSHRRILFVYCPIRVENIYKNFQNKTYKIFFREENLIVIDYEGIICE